MVRAGAMAAPAPVGSLKVFVVAAALSPPVNDDSSVWLQPPPAKHQRSQPQEK